MLEKMLPIGFILIFIGFALILISVILSKSKGDFVFVGLLGPIPFGIATREDLLKFGLIIILIILVIFLIFSRGL